MFGITSIRWTTWYLTIVLGVLVAPHYVEGASGCDGNGNCYISASAKGGGTGANWANAYTGFGTRTGQIDSSAMTRGVTYWIAAGSYGGVTFSTPDSEAATITLEAATTRMHGPASDWNDGLAGQAVFSASAITTDYWTFNGQTRASDWQSGYTLKFWNQSSSQGGAIYLGTHDRGVSNISLLYVELEGTGAGFPNNTSTADKCSVENCGVWQDNALYEWQPVSILYVGYGYAHHTGNTQFQMNATGPGGSINQNVTWEYNWISYNHTGQNGQHDEAFALLASNVNIRFNVFQDISGSGIICDASSTNPAMSNWFVYGNIFFNDSAYLALGQTYWLNTVDNGILALGDGDGNPETLTGTFLFANNTIANFNPPGVAAFNTYSTLPISGVPGGIAGTADVIIENNLWYASAFVYGNYNPICNQLSGTCTVDYNASFQGDDAISASNWHTQENPAAHDYNVSGTTSPFSGLQPALTIEGYEPAASHPFISNAGVRLSSPYDADMLGNLRGMNGTWDRGALQSIAVVPLISTTTTLTPSATQVFQGAKMTLTATVKHPSGSAVPTGTVIFNRGSTSLGSATLDPSGIAVFTAATDLVGAFSVTAVYGGDSTYAGSASAPLNLTVSSAPQTGFSLTASPMALAPSAGQTGTITLTVTPEYGFDGAVSFTCKGEAASVCGSFKPSTVTPSGSAATSILTLTTASVSSKAVVRPLNVNDQPLYGLVISGCLGLFAFSNRRKLGRPGVRRFVMTIYVSVVGMWIISCGGIGGTSDSPQPVITTVTVTASTSVPNSISHSVNLTMTVTQ